ncbi:restriction endonuclease subunit S [Mycobacterium sp. SMC-2]|uniref:restriction endonuclease subunit S n=1 Tax=Mycobacterium sp. SMC-2 TaxID=2857058 RepID=UPI0021B2D4BE|nr:restriction endonuclease subunit S [Mycobacterium sp. SMC-2]UXA07599.1 restriction endonuclease subunit S [Mycobacterium sp. SMC-2]
MSAIDQLVAELVSTDVPFLPLREVGTWYGGGTPSKAVPEYWENGSLPWLSPKDMVGGMVVATEDHISERALEKSTVKLVPAGSVAFVVRSNILRRRLPVALVPIQVTLNQDIRAVVPRRGILAEYLAQVCRARSQEILAVAGRTDGSMAAIQSTPLLDFRIPVPPIEIQRKIVRVLDEFTTIELELESVLDAEAAARQDQRAHVRTRVLNAVSGPDDSDTVALGEIVDFTNGKAHERLVVPDGSIALLTARFISTNGESARWVNPEGALTPALCGDIAMVMSDLPNGRALARCFFVETDGKYSANQRVCLLRVRHESGVSPRWLYHFLDRNPQLLALDNGRDQTHLKKGQILDIRVPVIPLAEQEQASAMLDRLDDSMRDLIFSIRAEREARRKQYEYYRDRLLMFEELAV